MWDELDVTSFARIVARPLSIRCQDPVPRGDGTWAIGLSIRRETRMHPVFLVVVPNVQRFQAVLWNLLSHVASPFVVVAPTSRHRTVEVQELLRDRGISFLALDEHLRVDDDGQIVTVYPPEQDSSVLPMPKDDRVRVVKEFTARHKCKVRSLKFFPQLPISPTDSAEEPNFPATAAHRDIHHATSSLFLQDRFT